MPKQKFLISIILTALFVVLLGSLKYVNAEWVDFLGEDVNFTHYKTPTSLWDDGNYKWAGRNSGNFFDKYKYNSKGEIVNAIMRGGYKVRENTIILRYKNSIDWRFVSNDLRKQRISLPIIDETWGVLYRTLKEDRYRRYLCTNNTAKYCSR